MSHAPRRALSPIEAEALDFLKLALAEQDSLDARSLDEIVAWYIKVGQAPGNPSDGLIALFDADAEALHQRIGKELDYWPHRYLQSVRRAGGYKLALKFLGDEKPSPGLLRICAAGRHDLTIEWLVLDKRFVALFDAGQRERALRRIVAAYQGAQGLEAERVAA